MLGYVALEYSIFWSMVLHFINNGVFAVIGIILIVREDGIARLNAYMAENAPEKGTWKKAFFNVIFIIAVIAVMLLSIFMIGPV